MSLTTRDMLTLVARYPPQQGYPPQQAVPATGTPPDPFSSTPMGIHSISFGALHVRRTPMGVHPTCGAFWRSIRFRLALHTYAAPPWGCIRRVVRLGEIKKNTHPKHVTALLRAQARMLSSSTATRARK